MCIDLHQMSEEKQTSEEGYVIEGNSTIATKGHLVLYSVTGGRVSYVSFVNNARNLGLDENFVPPIRKLHDSFAYARRNIEGMTLPSLEILDGWDGVVRRELNVISLKKGKEYVVRVKHTGRARGKNHTSTTNLLRLEYNPPEDFDAYAWRDAYMQHVWEENFQEANSTLQLLNACVEVSPYWEETEVDGMLYASISSALVEEFKNVAVSIDAKMLRDRIVNVLQTQLGGLPFRSGQGAYFIPKYGDNDSYLSTLENYSNLLGAFGSANALTGNPSQNNWYDANGKPRDWHRRATNLRIMGYIDNARQMEYIRNDIQGNLSREIAEYQEKILKTAETFNEDNVAAFERKLESIQGVRSDILTKLGNLSEMLGGEVNVQTEPFADISSGLNDRLNAIRPIKSSIADRLMNLSMLS